jgi:tetratricopeptide (TPR) repeat protein
MKRHLCLLLLCLCVMGQLAAQQTDQDDPRAKELRKQGISAMQKDDYTNAKTLLLQSLQVAQEDGVKLAEVYTRYHLGRTYYFADEAQKAVEQFLIVMQWAHEQHRGDLAGDTGSMLGMAYEKLGDKAAAIAEYKQALPLLDNETRPRTQQMLGRLLWENGDKQGADELINNAIAGYHANQNVVGEANALRLHSIQKKLESDYEAVLHDARQCLELLSTLPPEKRHSVTALDLYDSGLYDVASSLFELHRPDEAMKAVDEARAYYREHPEPRREADLDGLLGGYFQLIGNAAEARGYFLAAETKYNAAGRKEQSAAAKIRADESFGDHEQGTSDKLKSLQQAIDKAGDKLTKASLLKERGTLLRWANNQRSWQQAVSNLRESAALYADLLQEAEFRKDTPLQLSSMASTYSSVLRTLAMVQCFTGDVQGARQSREQMHAVTQRTWLTPDLRLMILKECTLADRAMKDYKLLQADVEEAMPLAKTIGNHSDLADMLTAKGNIREKAGDKQGALTSYLQAISELEDLSNQAKVTPLRQQRNEREAYDPYASAIRIFMMNDSLIESFNLSERARSQMFLSEIGGQRENRTKSDPLAAEARVLRQRLSQAEIERHTKPESILDPAMEALRHEYDELLLRMKLTDGPATEQVRAMPRTLAEIQSLLGKQQTLLSYQQVDIGLLIYVVTHDGISYGFSPVNGYEIDDIIERMFDPEQRGSASAKLYQLLIEPVSKELTTKLVTIAPYGSLRGLSFSMLSPDGKHYFGDEHVLSYTPSASALTMLPSLLRPTRPRIWVAENSDDAGRSGLSKTREEVAEVASLYGTQPVFEVTRAQFLAKAPEAEFVHLASHGEMPLDHPEQARLILKAADSNDGSLNVADIRMLDLHRTALVTVSACQVAKTTSYGNGLSLQNAFILAGAHSVIAPLWTVDDGVAKDLMLNLYRRLHGGASYGEALRLAQVETRRSHPDSPDWAAFILMGATGEE